MTYLAKNRMFFLFILFGFLRKRRLFAEQSSLQASETLYAGLWKLMVDLSDAKFSLCTVARKKHREG